MKADAGCASSRREATPPTRFAGGVAVTGRRVGSGFWIVRRVDGLFALADALEMKYRAAVERVERLTPSVLGKAFRGELVPQDPNDEPAELLLARIREQRAGATGKQPRRAVRPKRSVSTRLAKKRDRR